MTMNSQSPTRRSPLWMRILLGVSLALNLATIGIVTGAAYRILGPGGPPHPPSFGGAVIRSLPHDERKALVAEARKSVNGQSARREGLAPLVTALRADPFDVEAITALLQSQRNRQAAWAEAMQGAWLTRVSAMSAEERAAYADKIEEAEARRAERRKKKWKHGESRP
ncbi:MAG: periplasmic heavy metal sensor [Paracoccaceae bacterium]